MSHDGQPGRSSDAGDAGELAVGVLLLSVSAFFGYHSYQLERPAGLATAPGLLPAVVSGVLFILALVICGAALRRMRAGASTNGSLHARRSTSAAVPVYVQRATLVASATAVFYFLLLEYLHFELSASIFLAFMTWMFWPRAGVARRLTVSIAIPFLIAAVFQGGFGIPLPGDGSLVENLVYALGRGAWS